MPLVLTREVYDIPACEDWRALVTLQQLVLLATGEGVIKATVASIARRTCVPVTTLAEGLEELIRRQEITLDSSGATPVYRILSPERFMEKKKEKRVSAVTAEVVRASIGEFNRQYVEVYGFKPEWDAGAVAAVSRVYRMNPGNFERVVSVFLNMQGWVASLRHAPMLLGKSTVLTNLKAEMIDGTE